MTVYKRIKKDDIVKITTGKDAGKSGKVIEVNRKDGRVIVEGLNIVKKTMKKSKTNQNGGIKDIEAFLNISNVVLICPKCKKNAKVGIKVAGDKKSRFCKKCNAEIDG